MLHVLLVGILITDVSMDRTPLLARQNNNLEVCGVSFRYLLILCLEAPTGSLVVFLLAESLYDLVKKLESLSGETVSKIDQAEERIKTLGLGLVFMKLENERLKEENESLKEDVEMKGAENEDLRTMVEDLDRRNRELEEELREKKSGKL